MLIVICTAAAATLAVVAHNELKRRSTDTATAGLREARDRHRPGLRQGHRSCCRRPGRASRVPTLASRVGGVVRLQRRGALPVPP